MKEIVNKIIQHPNAKFLVLDILNETAPFLYNTLCTLNGWKNPDDVKIDLRRILEAYLATQNRLSYEYFIMRKPYKEFISDEETVRSAMIYLLNTLATRCERKNPKGNSFHLASIALYIALERKEEEFGKFIETLRADKETFSLNEALYVFWILN